jgi:hypothetical protein
MMPVVQSKAIELSETPADAATSTAAQASSGSASMSAVKEKAIVKPIASTTATSMSLDNILIMGNLRIQIDQQGGTYFYYIILEECA